ncbi:MAG: dTDP-4-dehydrorhamnose reductase [Hasllibacter sp.]
MSGAILVLGRTGQLATEIARADPAAVTRGREAADRSAPAGAARAVAARLGGAGAVVNAAAWTAVDAAEDEEEAALAVNAGAPAAIAGACAAAGVPFVQISTDYVFDGSGEAPWTEDAPIAPLGAYGRTKAEGEARVARAMEGRAPWAVLRTSWVVSAHGSNFVKTMLRLGAERDVLRVVDDQVGAPTPAAELARAALAMAGALAAGRGASGVFHLPVRPFVSWAGLAAHVMERAGLDCRIEPIPSSEYPTPAARPLNSRLGGGRLEAAFGIGPVDWRPGVAAIVDELRTLDAKGGAA